MIGSFINLVPRALSYLPYGARERERENLENAGHVAPEQVNYQRTWNEKLASSLV